MELQMSYEFGFDIPPIQPARDYENDSPPEAELSQLPNSTPSAFNTVYAQGSQDSYQDLWEMILANPEVVREAGRIDGEDTLMNPVHEADVGNFSVAPRIAWSSLGPTSWENTSAEAQYHQTRMVSSHYVDAPAPTTPAREAIQPSLSSIVDASGLYSLVNNNSIDNAVAIESNPIITLEGSSGVIEAELSDGDDAQSTRVSLDYFLDVKRKELRSAIELHNSQDKQHSSAIKALLASGLTELRVAKESTVRRIRSIAFKIGSLSQTCGFVSTEIGECTIKTFVNRDLQAFKIVCHHAGERGLQRASETASAYGISIKALKSRVEELEERLGSNPWYCAANKIKITGHFTPRTIKVDLHDCSTVYCLCAESQPHRYFVLYPLVQLVWTTSNLGAMQQVDWEENILRPYCEGLQRGREASPRALCIDSVVDKNGRSVNTLNSNWRQLFHVLVHCKRLRFLLRNCLYKDDLNINLLIGYLLQDEIAFGSYAGFQGLHSIFGQI